MTSGVSRLPCPNLVRLLLAGALAACLHAQERILIPARLNDQPLKLAFDTGASGLAIFRSVADQHDLKVVSPPANIRLKPGEILAGRTEPVKLELWNQLFPDTRLRVIDHPATLPLDIDGVVGWPNLRDNILFLGGSTLQFTLLKQVPPEAATWTRLRELKTQELLCLELPRKKSGPRAYLGIDTGAHAVRLSSAAWAEWRKAHPLQPATLEAYFMPGINLVIAEYVWADEITLGGLTLRGVPVTCMNPMETAARPPGTVAVLGLSALQRMDCVFDGKKGFFYARPLDTPTTPTEHNRLGAIFVPADSERTDDLVAHVAEGSPAAEAGVRDGDVLLKVDQLDVTPWRTQRSIMPLRRFWTQPPGTQLRLTLLRDGKNLQADVTLRNILVPASE